MRLLPVIALSLVLVPPAEMVFCQPRPSPPPAYVVHIPDMQTAEMSPDEKYFAALVVHRPKDVLPTAELQMWDFRQGTLLQAHSLPAPEAHSGLSHGTTLLRYASDGQLLVVYPGGNLLHVLRATDTEEVRTFQIQSHAHIDALEVSPTAHRLAVRMSGELRIYDLDSGEAIRSWRITQESEFRMWELLQVHPQLEGAGLAWRADGAVLAMSVADNPPCLRGGGTIYTFDLASNDDPRAFRVPWLPPSIVFGAGNHLYVASNTCGGYVSHWTLDLAIFDSASGRQIDKIPAGKVGFRGYIAISANKQTLLAHADREKTTFAGFEDSLRIMDEQWQLWDLSAGKLVLTLPVTGQLSLGGNAHLSSSGHFVYANRGQDLEVFFVPAAEK